MKKNLAEAAEARKFAEAKPQVSTTSYQEKELVLEVSPTREAAIG